MSRKKWNKTLFFLGIVLLIHQTEYADELGLECSPKTFTVKVGSDVNVTCKVHPPQDVSQKVVQCKLGLKTVHTRKKGQDNLDDQDPSFKDRTKFFLDEMDKGNILLQISNVTKEDAGNYSCSVLKLKINDTVTLIVEEPKNQEESEGDSNNAGSMNIYAVGFIGVIIGVGLIVGLFVLIPRILRPSDDAGGNGPGQANGQDQQRAAFPNVRFHAVSRRGARASS